MLAKQRIRYLRGEQAITTGMFTSLLGRILSSPPPPPPGIGRLFKSVQRIAA